jgi:hypothetical protein
LSEYIFNEVSTITSITMCFTTHLQGIDLASEIFLADGLQQAASPVSTIKAAASKGPR